MFKTHTPLLHYKSQRLRTGMCGDNYKIKIKIRGLNAVCIQRMISAKQRGDVC